MKVDKSQGHQCKTLRAVLCGSIYAISQSSSLRALRLRQNIEPLNKVPVKRTIGRVKNGPLLMGLPTAT